MYRLNHAIEAFLGSVVPPLGLQPSGGIIDHTVKRPGYFYYLVTSVAIRKHIKMSVYWETLLTSMGMFLATKEGHFGDMYSSGLS